MARRRTSSNTRPLEDIEYEKHFVAFLDVLGFRDIVFKDSNENRHRLKTYYNIANYIRDTWSRIPTKEEIRSLVISDSIILSVPQGADAIANADIFRHFCIAIANLQFHLALNNIWIRGAITFGDVCFVPADNLLVGPAYINAYELEQTIARYPRVLVDNKVLSILELESPHDLVEAINSDSNYSNWRGDILYDWSRQRAGRPLIRDVALFVDYLQFAFVDWGDYGNRLDTISDHLANNIRLSSSTYEKYKWVVDYLISKCGYPTESEVNPTQGWRRLLKL